MTYQNLNYSCFPECHFPELGGSWVLGWVDWELIGSWVLGGVGRERGGSGELGGGGVSGELWGVQG